MILEILFPKRCVGCGALGSYVCLRCEGTLRLVTVDTCLYCGKPSLCGFTHPLCGRKQGVDGLLTCFYYNSLVKQVVKHLKYRLAWDIVSELQTILPPAFLTKFSIFNTQLLFFQPIPLHSEKEKQRGFNQALLLTQLLLPYAANSEQLNCLERVKNTLPQAQLSSVFRSYNVKGAFTCKARLDGKAIMLVDDVVTTGSTVKEACRILKKNGAKSVYVVALARG